MKRQMFVLLFPCAMALVMLSGWLNLSRLNAAAPSSPSTTFTVNSTIDTTDANPGNGVCETAPGNGICTLRAAIQESNALAGADIINIPTGIFLITLDGINEDNAVTGDLDIKDDLTINGVSPQDTILDGNDLDRLFHITGNSTPTVIIAHLTIQNGQSFHPDAGYLGVGGCVLNNNGTLNVNDAIFYNNYRGCLYNAGTMTVTNSLAQNNPGTAISNLITGTMFIENMVIENSYIGINNDNIAQINGTAISGGYDGINNKGIITIGATTITSNNFGIITNGQMSLLNSAVTHNLFGGIQQGSGFNYFSSYIANTNISYNSHSAIELQGGSMQITHSEIHHNIHTAGIKADSVLTLTIHNSSIHHNSITTSYGCGGGIAFTGKTFMLSNSVVYANQHILGKGGGVCVLTWNTELGSTIVNSTISNNLANNGGGVSFSGQLYITNTTIYANEATSIGGISRVYDGFATVNNSIIANNGGGNCEGMVIVSSGHNLESSNSCNFANTGDLSNTNPLLGPLQNNGGSTWTHALLTNSPAIDAGDNVSCPATDQRGYGRPVDGDGDTIPVCDIGAYEFNATSYALYLPLLLKP